VVVLLQGRFGGARGDDGLALSRELGARVERLLLGVLRLRLCSGDRRRSLRASVGKVAGGPRPHEQERQACRRGPHEKA
jgi:hypothetical protein